MLLIAPFVMHHMPLYWGDDVEAFVPERFMKPSADHASEATSAAATAGSGSGSGGAGSVPRVDGPSTAFFPFLCGPRSCIGSRFALLEMKVLLATIVASYSLTLKPGAVVVPKQRVTMQPFPSLPMLLHKVVV